MSRDPSAVTDVYAAAYAMVLGYDPVTVYTLPARPDRFGPSRIPVVFQFDADAAKALAEYWQGSDETTQVPARRWKQQIDRAFAMCREARLRLTERVPHDDDRQSPTA